MQRPGSASMALLPSEMENFRFRQRSSGVKNQEKQPCSQLVSTLANMWESRVQ